MRKSTGLYLAVIVGVVIIVAVVILAMNGRERVNTSVGDGLTGEAYKKISTSPQLSGKPTSVVASKNGTTIIKGKFQAVENLRGVGGNGTMGQYGCGTVECPGTAVHDGVSSTTGTLSMTRPCIPLPPERGGGCSCPC